MQGFFYLLFLSFLSVITPLTSGATPPHTLCLKDRFLKGGRGEYIVTEYSKICALVCIHSIDQERLIIEEISLPSSSKPSSFKKWVEQGAPGHLSWNIFEINLINNELIEAYSFSKKCWLDIKKNDLFFLKLLSLQLTETDPKERKRVGVKITGEVDRRKFWFPPMIIEGSKQFSQHCVPYEAKWPSDGSEFANKKLAFYLNESTTFPFPYWIEIQEARGSFPMKIVDSGTHLHLPHHKVPKRAPHFLNSSIKRPTGISLKLYLPSYHKPFSLAAIDLHERKSIPMTYSIKEEAEGIYQIEIPQEELASKLEKNHLYLWLCVPETHPQYACETLSPFIWTQ